MSWKGEKPRSVPRFGSFRPKPSPKPELETSPPEESHDKSTKEESRAPKRHKLQHRDDGRDHRHSRHDRHDRHAEDLRAHERSVREVSKRDVKPPAVNDLFTYDKRGDPLIVRYGGLECSSVPKYRRIGRGIILGTNGFLEIHRDKARDEFSIVTSRERGSAFRDRNLLAEAGRMKPRLFKENTKQGPSVVAEEFISVEPSKKRKRRNDDEEESGSEAQNYRSIEGKAKPEEDSDSAFEGDIDEDEDAEGRYISPTKRRSIELSRIVKEHPENTQAWLELIDLQEGLFRENEEIDHSNTRDEVKAVADIKVSMYEKALPHAKSTQDREKLLIGLTREGSRIWTSQKLAKRWDEVTKEDENSFALWKSRMDFELGNIATFSFDQVKERFIRRIQFVNDQSDQAEQAIYVFLRLTRFLQDSGFTDLAVGAWQAMLELHLVHPTESTKGREETLADFEEFWEIETPRLGEPGAVGWRKYMEDRDSADLPEPKTLSSREVSQTRDLYKAWAGKENQHALEGRMPARTADIGAYDDPYRVVMFADIEPLLPFIPADRARHYQPHIIDAYLMFCGLPPAFAASFAAYGDGSLLKAAYSDPFIVGRSKAFSDRIQQVPDVSGIDTERKKKPPEFKQDASHMVMSPDVLFSGPSWFGYLASWRDLYPTHDEPVERSLILMTIRQLVRQFGFEDLAEYHLALEWLNERTSAKRVAKVVIKQYPLNLRFYNAYALIEAANGNRETALNVLSAALGMDANDRDLGAARQMLRNTWAWIELGAGQKTAALCRLCSDQVVDSSVSPAGILQAKSQTSTALGHTLTSGTLDDAVEYATTLALIAYLSPGDTTITTWTTLQQPLSAAQGDIEAAMASITTFLNAFALRDMNRHPALERFLQFAARLLYHHTTRGPHRPNYLRAQLAHFLTLFPDNTIFLSLFTWAVTSLRIDDPVRPLLQTTLSTHDSVPTRLFAIRHELDSGTVHSVRGAFEAAVESEICRHSAQLWIYYIRFCHARKELKGKAKEVFYRAIAACPGSKELYMEAFGTLVREMESRELRAVVSTVESKGLRVHVDLEEFIKQWEKDHGGREAR